MTYFFLYTTTQLTSRNKLAIHAKRQTIMPHDMQLLWNLWRRISPESAIGADDADTVRAKRVWQEQERRRIASWKESVQAPRDEEVVAQVVQSEPAKEAEQVEQE